MSAHSRGNLSVEASFAHLLTAIVRQNGGEFRIKGSVVDMAGEPAALIREWDSEKQEVVLRCGMGQFVEIYRVIPERQPGNQVAVPAAPPANGHAVDPLASIFRETPPAVDTVEKSRSVSTLEGERLVELENKLKKIRLKRMFQEEIEANRRKAAQQERTTP
jgi:hypothetical protein